MKTFTLLFFLLLATVSNTKADFFEEAKQDPSYREVESQCVQGNPARTLLHLQKEFGLDLAYGLKEGLISAAGIENPLNPDATVAKQWASTPLYLGLLDCFGNTEKGLILTQAFMIELVMGYSTSQALSWGATTLLGVKAFSLFSHLAVGGFVSLAKQIPWLSEFMESNPELLPRARIALKWTSTGIGAYLIKKQVNKHDEEEQTINQEKEQQAVLVNEEQDALSKQVAQERAFEMGHTQEAIAELKTASKNCTTEISCQKINTLLVKLENESFN
jgi:hypothetical protein